MRVPQQRCNADDVDANGDCNLLISLFYVRFPPPMYFGCSAITALCNVLSKIVIPSLSNLRSSNGQKSASASKISSEETASRCKKRVRMHRDETSICCLLMHAYTTPPSMFCCLLCCAESRRLSRTFVEVW